MAINKVEYSGKVLIDLTSDTVTQDKLFDGVLAHDKSGNIISGTYIPKKTSVFYTGSKPPDNSIGMDGDLYFEKGV